jgi:hypothetical protein
MALDDDQAAAAGPASVTSAAGAAAETAAVSARHCGRSRSAAAAAAESAAGSWDFVAVSADAPKGTRTDSACDARAIIACAAATIAGAGRCRPCGSIYACAIRPASAAAARRSEAGAAAGAAISAYEREARAASAT